jgi:hypothetical protein
VSTLVELQGVFSVLVARLILRASTLGYLVTLGEATRTPEQMLVNYRNGSGTLTSLHGERLAIDLNLFKYGQYQRDTQAYAELGAWWKLQHRQARWGGDFKRRDGNHFSLSPDGERA